MIMILSLMSHGIQFKGNGLHSKKGHTRMEQKNKKGCSCLRRPSHISRKKPRKSCALGNTMYCTSTFVELRPPHRLSSLPPAPYKSRTSIHGKLPSVQLLLTALVHHGLKGQLLFKKPNHYSSLIYEL